MAKDLVSDLAELLLRKKEEYNPVRGSVTAWGKAMLVRLAKQRRRKADRVGVRVWDDEVWQAACSAEPPPEHRAEHREAWQRVQKGLAQLPALEREIFELYHRDSMDSDELARRTKISRVNLRVKLLRIKRKLQALLDGQEGRP